ncbi:MAG: hypothetical protein GKR99_12165 [Rhodobacteraceae bacterium]|nr:hypothetical protein [Paracoccaceae bacterium]NKB54662.1 hypothetical protein [Rhizobiaceae bacterium]
MKRASILAVISIIMAPSMAAAMGCSGYGHKTETASNCMDGTQWDSALEACVPVVTG